MVIDCITRVINWSISYIKAIRGVVRALVAIKKIFGGTHPFNKVLGS